MAVLVDVIRAIPVPVIFDPAVVGVATVTPLNQGGLTDPSVVVILNDAAEGFIIPRVEDFGVSLGEHYHAAILQAGDGGVGEEAVERSLQRVASRFVGEDGVEQIALDGQTLVLGDGQFGIGRRLLIGPGDGTAVILQIKGEEPGPCGRVGGAETHVAIVEVHLKKDHPGLFRLAVAHASTAAT